MLKQGSASKAACASHIYGPKLEYTVTTLKTLEGKNDEILFISEHVQNSVKLYENGN